MSSSDLKPITINPELFKLKNNKNKTLKKNIKTVRNIEPNKLKSDLLNKIKNYREKKKEDNFNLVNRTQKQSINEDEIEKKEKTMSNFNEEIKIKMDKDISNNLESNDEFMESINFLKNLSSKKNENTQQNSQNIPISLDNNFNVEKDIPSIDKKPQYSCLKNSTLPTYREWKKQTQKNNYDNLKPNLVCNDKENDKSIKRSVTYKYTLGKSGKKVSVLIKNNETRKKISNEHQKIKEVNVSDMKKYLKRHNLVKSGSFAPPHLIKKIYEQSLLSGDIKNKSAENILSNI